MDVKLRLFWEAVALQLASARMDTILMGAGRIYDSPASLPEQGEADRAPWGRLVIVPGVVPGGDFDRPDEPRQVLFLVRAEFADYRTPEYDVRVSLDAAHEEAKALLWGWMPPQVPGMRVLQGVYRFRYPIAQPLLDSERGVWFTSAEYRTLIAP